jgi:hypothetical protein
MKRLGQEKAKALEEKAPGCTLSGWLDLNYKHVTLEKTISEGSKRLVVPQSNVELTIALLSTDNVVDWARVAFHWAPSGTIIDKVPVKYWEEKVLLLRQLLTKKLVLDPDDRLARRYLSILERRDADRWAQKTKGMSIKASASTDGEAKNEQSKKVVFDFEIV